MAGGDFGNGGALRGGEMGEAPGEPCGELGVQGGEELGLGERGRGDCDVISHFLTTDEHGWTRLGEDAKSRDAGEAAAGCEGVDFGGGFVGADAGDAGEAESEAAFVAGARLDAVEGDF